MVKQPLKRPPADGAAPPPDATTSGVAGYFAQELADLAQVGRALSASHPELARHLGRQAMDPDIERLLEGTAFLCSQIRARNDACAPELTCDLADLLAPWLLRPVPAATLVGFVPDLRHAPARELVAQHTPLQAHAEACGFRTTTAIPLHPIMASDPQWHDGQDNCTTLQVPCALGPQASWQTLADDGLTFYIDGPYAEASALYLALVQHVRRAWVEVAGCPSPIAVTLGADTQRTQVPLTPQFDGEAPIPLGIALLRDHMILPNKFLFVHVRLPPDAVSGPLGAQLRLNVQLSAEASLLPRRQGLSLKLHCVPAHNVVAQDGMPLRHTWAQSRHVLRPEPARHPTPGAQAEILAVRAVTAAAHQGPPKPLWPWHQRRVDPCSPHSPWPVWALEFGPGAPMPVRLRVFADAVSGPSAMPEATLSVRLWCHGGAAAGRMDPGTLQLAPHALGRTRATNLVASTRPRPPLAQASQRFALLGLVQARSRTAPDARALAHTLGLLQLDGEEDGHDGRAQALRIASIIAVQARPQAKLWGHAAVLCLDLELELALAGFASLGDAYIFASCIDALWSDHQPVHGPLCTHLKVPALGRRYTLPLRCGDVQRGPGAYRPL